MAQGNIQQYTSPVDKLQPSEVGAEAYTRAGAQSNRIFTELGASTEQVGRQVGSDIGSGLKAALDAGQEQVEHQQISRGVAAKASLMDTLDQTWQETLKTSDPNNTTTAAAFKQNVLEPELENWQNGFTDPKTQTWATEQADRIREHFNTVTAVGMGDQAAQAGWSNLKTMGNSWTNMALRDPGSVPLLLSGAEKDISDTVNSMPNLRGADAAKMKAEFTLQAKESIIKGGMFKAIQDAADPGAAAQAWIAKYPDFIKPTEADHAVRIATADQAAKVRLQGQQEKTQALARTDQYVTDAASGQPKMSVADIWKDPAYANRPDLRAEAAGVIDKMRAFDAKTAEVDPGLSHSTVLGLVSRMALPDTDPNRITDRQTIDKAFTTGTLSKADYTFALGQLKAMDKPGETELAKSRDQFFKDYGASAAGTGGTGIFANPQAAYAAQQDAIRQEKALAAQGKDPHSLYDPASPNFFGRPDSITRYLPSLWDKQTETAPERPMSTAMAGYAKAIQGNESIDPKTGQPNYQAVSAASKDGDKAYGAYGVMGKNVGPWTAKYYGRRLSPEEFLGNHEAQDAVFQGEFGRLASLYGPEGAARAWYAGEGGMNNLSATDVYGKTTVGAYGEKFAKAAGVPVSLPPSMTPQEAAIKYAGQRVRLPDGRIGVFPAPNVPMSK